MGLFTNRKRDEDGNDIVASADALSFAAEPSYAVEPAASGAADALPATMAELVDPAGMSDASDDTPTSVAPSSWPESAEWLTPVEEEAVVPSSPMRRLEDRPRAQAGNVEIDADGLLALLGVEDDASLRDISEARQRFLEAHRVDDADDADAAALKERIRREVNSAYASFRLTHGD